jgi:hypothetical protein
MAGAARPLDITETEVAPVVCRQVARHEQSELIDTLRRYRASTELPSARRSRIGSEPASRQVTDRVSGFGHPQGRQA